MNASHFPFPVTYAGESGGDPDGAGIFQDDINRYLAGAFMSNDHKSTGYMILYISPYICLMINETFSSIGFVPSIKKKGSLMT